MRRPERPDDFQERRQHLSDLTDEQLHERFWGLVGQIVDPLVEEARTHTTPAIERSVLLRMGLSSLDAKSLVNEIHKRGLLGHGAGRLVLGLAEAKGVTIGEAATALLEGRWWGELAG